MKEGRKKEITNAKDWKGNAAKEPRKEKSRRPPSLERVHLDIVHAAHASACAQEVERQ